MDRDDTRSLRELKTDWNSEEKFRDLHGVLEFFVCILDLDGGNLKFFTFE